LNLANVVSSRPKEKVLMRVIFRAALIGSAVFGLHSSLLASGGLLTPLVRSGDLVPGRSNTFSAVKIGGVSEQGTAFIGEFYHNQLLYSGLYLRSPNGSISTLVAPDTSTNPAPRAIQRITATSDLVDGTILFSVHAAAGDSLYRYTPSGLQTIVQGGDALPDWPAGVGASGIYDRGFGGSGSNVAVGIKREDGTYGVYTIDADRNITAVADHRLKAPAPEMGNFIGFPEVIYAGDRAAFVGRAEERDRPGQIENAGLFQQTTDGYVNPLVIRNRPIPGNNPDPSNLRFREFERPRYIGPSEVAFAGGFIDEYNPGSTVRQMGVYIGSFAGTTVPLVDNNDVLPGLRAAIDEFTGFNIQGTGGQLFAAKDFNGQSVLFLKHADGSFENLLDSYTAFDGKTISQFRLAPDGNYDNFYTLRVNFTDGSSGIYGLSLVPEPASLLILTGSALALLRRRA
jgi:hypothetical protein